MESSLYILPKLQGQHETYPPPIKDDETLRSAAFACCLAVKGTIFGGDASSCSLPEYLQKLNIQHDLSHACATSSDFDGQKHVWAFKRHQWDLNTYFFACRESAEPSDWVANLSAWGAPGNYHPGTVHAGM